MKLRFARCMKEYVDIDYWKKLTREQKKWLESFLESEYNARPSQDASKADKVRSYRRKYLAKNDVFSSCNRLDVWDFSNKQAKYEKKKKKRSSKIAMILMKCFNGQETA